jgi:hypothetical protein
MRSNKFNQYLQLKSQVSITIKKIPFEKVLTPELIKIFFSKDFNNEVSYFEIVKIFFRQISFNKVRDAFQTCDIVVTNSNDRNDNLELINSCFKTFKNLKHIKLTSLNRRIGLNHNLKELNTVFPFFMKKDNELINFKAKLYLAVSTIYYLNALRSLEQAFSSEKLVKLLHTKKYIAFNSAYDLETLITLFLKDKNVKTYHLSHGISYISYKNFKPFDSVNGENICADTILVWGESSKLDLLANYNNAIIGKSIYISGNPKYPLKSINLKNTFLNGVVFLGRSIYDMENKELLLILSKVATEIGINFSIKIHPFSDEKQIKKIIDLNNLTLIPKKKTVFEILNESSFDFAISFNTTVYYEAMYYNLFCFRFGLNENENYTGLNDKFKTSQELINLINKYKNKHFTDINNDVTQLLSNTLGMGINNFKQILSNE